MPAHVPGFNVEQRYESEGIRLSYMSSRVFGAIAGLEDQHSLVELLARRHGNYVLRTLRKYDLIDGFNELTERGERFAGRVYLPMTFPSKMQTEHFGFGDLRLPRRFWAKAIPEPMSGCWLWFGAAHERGYGHFCVNHVVERAHRVAYKMLVGPIDDDLEIDHKCRTQCCVNPHHLEVVTHSTNIQRWWDTPAGIAERERREH